MQAIAIVFTQEAPAVLGWHTFAIAVGHLDSMKGNVLAVCAGRKGSRATRHRRRRRWQLVQQPCRSKQHRQHSKRIWCWQVFEQLTQEVEYAACDRKRS